MTPRIMIAGTASGCGKTTAVCAVLAALVNRGVKAAAFKCGPDYIDPMFHSRIIGTPSYNLDGYFMDKETLRELMFGHTRGMDIAVLEGVMGYMTGLEWRIRQAHMQWRVIRGRLSFSSCPVGEWGNPCRR